MARVKKIKSIHGKEILSAFDEMIGGQTNFTLIWGKYTKMKTHIFDFIKTLEVLNGSSIFTHYPTEKHHLTAYIQDLRQSWVELPDISDFVHAPNELLDLFVQQFMALKEGKHVNVIITTCKNLMPHKKLIENANPKFLTHDGGILYCPISNAPFVNFKSLYCSDMLLADERRLLLLVLQKIYQISHQLYTTILEPEIDVNEFVEVVTASINEVKKQIPRCEQAFQKVLDSIHLLKSNFTEYYKDYVLSKNPTVIMENFVLDVSKNTSASPRVIAQFRKIIEHYRKLASQKGTLSPKMQKIFTNVEKNFAVLESQE